MADDSKPKVTRIGKFGGAAEAAEMLREMATTIEKTDEEVTGVMVLYSYRCSDKDCGEEHVAHLGSARDRFSAIGMLEDVKLDILENG